MIITLISPDTMSKIARAMMMAQQPARYPIVYVIQQVMKNILIQADCFQKDKNKIFLVLQIPYNNIPKGRSTSMYTIPWMQR
jgi:hypothetical protein